MEVAGHVGFEIGLKTMAPGGQRRIVVPPELGPPVGPSTFFSAKQCEVFDVELLGIKQCRREGALMFSKVVCG
jgi:FKBP-type peptidyl-prolyl cis-trans isomerase